MSSIDDIGNAEPLKPKQIKALAALSAGATDERAAGIVGVSCPTIARWRKLPAFQSALSESLRLQRDRIQGILGAIAQDSEQVVRDALGAVGDDGRPQHATRLRAAELAFGSYARVAQRADAAATAPSGPLIVLPPGTQRMALALDDGSGGAGSAQVQALPQALPSVTPVQVLQSATEGNVVDVSPTTALPTVTSAGVRRTIAGVSTSPGSQTRSLPPSSQPAIALGPDPDDAPAVPEPEP